MIEQESQAVQTCGKSEYMEGQESTGKTDNREAHFPSNGTTSGRELIENRSGNPQIIEIKHQASQEGLNRDNQTRSNEMHLHALGNPQNNIEMLNVEAEVSSNLSGITGDLLLQEILCLLWKIKLMLTKSTKAQEVIQELLKYGQRIKEFTSERSEDKDNYEKFMQSWKDELLLCFTDNSVANEMEHPQIVMDTMSLTSLQESGSQSISAYNRSIKTDDQMILTKLLEVLKKSSCITGLRMDFDGMSVASIQGTETVASKDSSRTLEILMKNSEYDRSWYNLARLLNRLSIGESIEKEPILGKRIDEQHLNYDLTISEKKLKEDGTFSIKSPGKNQMDMEDFQKPKFSIMSREDKPSLENEPPTTSDDVISLCKSLIDLMIKPANILNIMSLFLTMCSEVDTLSNLIEEVNNKLRSQREFIWSSKLAEGLDHGVSTLLKQIEEKWGNFFESIFDGMMIIKESFNGKILSL